MQEAAGGVVVVERLVDFVAREHAGQRQVAAGDALGEAQQVGRDVGLLACEQRPGAPEAGHHLVGDQQHLVLRAQRARAAQERRMVEAHAAGALHQRLDHHRGDLVVLVGEQLLQRLGRGRRAVDAGVVMVLRVPAREGGHERGTQERRIRLAEDRDVGHAQGPERLPVVSALESDEAVLPRASAVRPVMRRHLERDLHRRGAVGCEERVTEPSGREAREALRQLHRGAVGEARQHHVLEGRELLGDRGVDRRVGVAEQVHPPRAHAVQVAASLEIVEPRALRMGDRHEGEAFVRLHLRARMPDRGQAARDDFGVAHASPWRCG